MLLRHAKADNPPAVADIDRPLTARGHADAAAAGAWLAHRGYVPDLVELVTLDSTITLEIRYATTNNFVGAVFYALRRPNPWPTVFGHHEFFHACTVVAALCHHIGVYFAVFA